MAFTLQTLGRSSTNANEPVTTLADGTLSGCPRTYTYYSNDSQATIAAAGYFNSIFGSLSAGDRIEAYSATDGTTVTYNVSASSSTAVTASASNILVASGTITAAQFIGMYAAPIQLVAAPGANRVLIVNNAHLAIVYGTTQYTTGGAVIFQYTATANGAGTNTCATTIAAASVNGATANNFATLNGAAQGWGLSATLGNQGIYLSNATAAFAAGDSTFKYSIQYRIAPLA